ncbi:MAG: CDP-diacylglycerol--glycerol-3-phosphate 3-phosphatidyltransferase [Sporichthyaceae bacterium]
MFDAAPSPGSSDRATSPPDHLADPVTQAGAWNLANGLTGFRLALVPVFVLALLAEDGDSEGWRWVAWGVFALASFTDTMDGRIARRRGTVTDFGKIADPIADKALTGAALIALSSMDELAWTVTAVILTREIGVTLLRFWVIRHGVIPASRGGKLKSLILGVAIGLYVLPLRGLGQDVAAALMAVAVVVVLATGIDYVSRALRLRRESVR